MSKQHDVCLRERVHFIMENKILLISNKTELCSNICVCVRVRARVCVYNAFIRLKYHFVKS